MNLYLVTRTDSPAPGLAWKAFAVAAPTAEHSKATHPNGLTGKGWHESGALAVGWPVDWIPLSKRDQLLKVRLLRANTDHTENTPVFSQATSWPSLQNLVSE